MKHQKQNRTTGNTWKAPFEEGMEPNELQMDEESDKTCKDEHRNNEEELRAKTKRQKGT